MKLAFPIAMIFLAPTAVHAAPCVTYGPHAVSGTVKRVMFYGPPNFGEAPKTDEKGFYPVLELDRALAMCARDKDGFSNRAIAAREMQMVFAGAVTFDKAWYGKRVTVRGALFAAETGNHHTPVMLDVGTVQMTQ